MSKNKIDDRILPTNTLKEAFIYNIFVDFDFEPRLCCEKSINDDLSIKNNC